MRFLRLSLATLVVLAAPAAAQQPDSTIFRLPAVVVSIMRSPVRVIDAPLAVTVVTREELEGRNGHRIDEALKSVPGVLAQSRAGGTDIRLVIRGFGARGAGDRSNSGTSRGIRILSDGFPETEPDGRTAFDLIDLAAVERVEVVRSNASALWGNASGGLVSFSSLPERGERGFTIERTQGGFGLGRTVVRGVAPFGTGQFYLTALRTDFDGWRAHSEQERTLLNVGVQAPLGDNTNLRVSAVGADNSFNIPGPLTLAQLNADPTGANPTYLTRRERRHNRLGRIGLELDHNITPNNAVSGMVFANPKLLQRSERGTFRDFTRYHIGGNVAYQNRHSFSESVQSRFSAGAYEAYQDVAILFYSLTAAGERGPTLSNNKREGANTFGVYAQEVLAFGAFEATLGARYDNVTYYAQDFITPTLDDTRSYEKLTPKLGLLYKLAGTHSVYANLGGGIEVPAGNETDPVPGTTNPTALNALLDPIESTTYEIGTKHALDLGTGFLRGLFYDLALYRMNVSNEIVPYQGGRYYFTAAEAQRTGAELGLELSTAPGLTLRGALTVSKNTYPEYVVDSTYYSRPGQRGDFSGNRIVGIPDWFYNVSATYVPGFLNQLRFRLEVDQVDTYFANDANTTEVEGYTLWSAGVGFARPLVVGGMKLRASAHIENLFDTDYIASAFLNPDLVGGVPAAYEPGLPRHLVVSVSVGR